MTAFAADFKFIIGFLIGTMFFHMMMGTKATMYFLALVLIGMLVVNKDKVSKFMGV